MKKRILGVLLSMAVSVSMLGEAGATALTESDLLTSGEEVIPEETGEAVEAAETAEPADVTETTETAETILPEAGETLEDTDPTVEPAQNMENEDDADPLLLPDESNDLPTVIDEASAVDAITEELTAGELMPEDAAETLDLLIEVTETPETAETDELAEDSVTPEVFADGSVLVGSSSWVSTSAGFKLKRPAGKSVETPAVEASDSSESLIIDDEETLVETEDAAETGSGEKASEYFTAADGVLQVTTQTTKGSHTGYYMFTADGILVTGRVSVAKGTPGYTGAKGTQMFFADSANAELYSEYTNTAKTPVTSNLGQRKADFWYYESPRFYYFDPEGIYITMPDLLASQNNPKYFEINGSYYSLKSSGIPRVGLCYLGGSAYYFQPDSEIPGAMLLNSWQNFTNSNGNEKWMYFRPESAGKHRGKASVHTGYYISKINKLSSTEFYLLNKDGYIQKSKKVTCENGKVYASDAQGKAYRDKLVKIGSFRYYFTKSGALADYKNQWVRLGKNTGRRYFYFGGAAGRVVEKRGYQKLTDADGTYKGWLYFPSTGNHYINRFFEDRYFGVDGIMYSGRRTINGDQYLFRVSSSTSMQGKMYKGTMVRYDNRWFYAQSNGKLYKQGWIQLNGNWYHFWSYSPQISTFLWHGSTYGYVNGDGIFRTGWIVYSNTNNKVRYVNPNGGGWYKNCSAVIDGLRYYFDEEGFRINDLTHIYTGNYYVTVDRVNGVCTVYDSSRTVPVKSIRVSVGAAGTETPTGTYYLRAAGRWQLLMGPSYGQYGTNVVGAGLGGIFFHSIPCASPSHYAVPSVPYSILGYPASHGCIRCCVADAKFIYERCNGATVRIFDGTYNNNEALKGPLGRNRLIPMTGSYDPTDPAVVG